MPKAGSKLRIRLIDPNYPVPQGTGQTLETFTIDNKNAYVWISLVEKLVYSTGEGETYQKKTMSFDNSMEPDVEEKSERKCKVRRVTYKARGLYSDEPWIEGQGAEEDRDYEFIDVEDIQEFTIREMSGQDYVKTTFLLNYPDGIATTRDSSKFRLIDPDTRRSHRVRIFKQIWIPEGFYDNTALEGRVRENRWYGIDFEDDDVQPDPTVQFGIPTVWVEIERLDEFTTTKLSEGEYQKTHWKVIWPDENASGEKDSWEDEQFDKFLFGENLDKPPDDNGDPTDMVEEENEKEQTKFLKRVTTDILMPEKGRGWRLDPFQTITNIYWGYSEPSPPRTLFFQFLNTPGWGTGVYTPPPGAVVAEHTQLYVINGYSEAAVRGAASSNDNSYLPGYGPSARNFYSMWQVIDSLNPPSEGNRHLLWASANFVPASELEP